MAARAAHRPCQGVHESLITTFTFSRRWAKDTRIPCRGSVGAEATHAARADLDEAKSVAHRSGMSLHLAKARSLIDATGYERRRYELDDAMAVLEGRAVVLPEAESVLTTIRGENLPAVQKESFADPPAAHRKMVAHRRRGTICRAPAASATAKTSGKSSGWVERREPHRLPAGYWPFAIFAIRE